MARLAQLVLILSTLGLSWLGMMAVHELGHVVAALASGGTVAKVVLPPLAFSRTDFERNPHPLLSAWGGGAVGVLLPVLVFGAAWRLGWRTTFLFRFFAGFCLIANGAYLGVGSWEGIGDAGDLIRAGAPRWALVAFGLVTIPVGFYLWNGLGRAFGLGRDPCPIDRTIAFGTLGLLSLAVLLELIFSGR